MTYRVTIWGPGEVGGTELRARTASSADSYNASEFFGRKYVSKLRRCGPAQRVLLPRQRSVHRIRRAIGGRVHRMRDQGDIPPYLASLANAVFTRNVCS